MSDPIGKPSASKPEDALRPEAGFHDDHVGGLIKSDEAAKKRAQEAKLARTPQRIIKEPEQVGAASSFLPAQQESDENASIRRQRSLVAGKALAPAAQRPQANGRAELERARRQVQSCFGAIAELGEQGGEPREAAPTEAKRAAGARLPVRERQEEQGRNGREQNDGDGADLEGEGVSPKPPSQAPEKASVGPLAQAEQRARYHLQSLIAGGAGGLTPQPEPSATFAPIFAALTRWPARVPPGRTPQSEQDYDQFLAWVFMPLPHPDTEHSNK